MMALAGLHRQRNTYETIESWASQVYAAYRAANPDQAKWFDMDYYAYPTEPSFSGSADVGKWAYIGGTGAYTYVYNDNSLYFSPASNGVGYEYGYFRIPSSRFYSIGRAFADWFNYMLRGYHASRYLLKTFGPWGTNSVTADEFRVWFANGRRAHTATTGVGNEMEKTGTALHWEVLTYGVQQNSGATPQNYDIVNTSSIVTAVDQDRQPDFNLGTFDDEGMVIVATEDGWSGITTFCTGVSNTSGGAFSGAVPHFPWNSMTSMTSMKNAHHGWGDGGYMDWDNLRLPSATRLDALTDMSWAYAYLSISANGVTVNFAPGSAGNLCTVQRIFYECKFISRVIGGSVLNIDCTHVNHAERAMLGQFGHMKLSVTNFGGVTNAAGAVRVVQPYYTQEFHITAATACVAWWNQQLAPTLDLSGITTTIGSSQADSPVGNRWDGDGGSFDGPPQYIAGTGNLTLAVTAGAIWPIGGTLSVDLSAGLVDCVHFQPGIRDLSPYQPYPSGNLRAAIGSMDLSNVRQAIYLWYCLYFTPATNIGSHADFTHFVMTGWYANDFSAANIDNVFTNLADRTSLAPATIYINGNPGTGSQTDSIATAKNWIVDTVTTNPSVTSEFPFVP